MTSRQLFAARLAPLFCLAACTPEPVPYAVGEEVVAGEETVPDQVQGRVYERDIVFLSTRADSTLLVPWLISARTQPGGVLREVRGWLARGGDWEPFFTERWETPPTRVPERILPRGPMRLIMAERDVLERLVFESGPRQLEVLFDQPLAEWSGRRGGSYRLLEGSVLLASQRVSGVLLDLVFGRSAEAPPLGDWAVLTSGDSLQMVVVSPQPSVPGSPAVYQGWARLETTERHWPAVTVEWTETRAFERARRDVPAAWSLVSGDGELEGSLQVHTAQMQPGDGEGPILPVDGLFEVAGSVRVGAVEYPVVGIVRHRQR